MALKTFEQVFPGQNSANIKPKKKISEKDWEHKQRIKEYRIAARREKRNRKSDEKKQRELNAIILRRMTRNPIKYTRNAARNKIQGIDLERRKIQNSAVRMAERLAAVYDPSGAMFNVSPVVTLEDGRVMSVEALQRRKERDAQRAAERNGEKTATYDGHTQVSRLHSAAEPAASYGNVNSIRMQMIQSHRQESSGEMFNLSKNQQKKQAETAFQPPPPKPVIPEGIDIPSDEEEDWLKLWDLEDGELESRILRAKKRATRERKEFRKRQSSNKLERRAARDEKRKVYRSIKQSWQVIRREERKRRIFLVSIEDEERKRLAVQVNIKNRKDAMDVAAALGFTLENVEGVEEIKPITKGMKGMHVDFNILEKVGDGPSGLKVLGEKGRERPKGNRVDLGAIPDETQVSAVFGSGHASGANASGLGQQDFVGFGKEDVDGHEAQPLTYSHRVRRKLRRAMESAAIRQEVLVRSKAIEHCEKHGLEVPAALMTPARPISIRGQRSLPSGLLETDKQERVRARVELAEFNKQARVLRKQAKEMAIEAGIRIYLELIGRIPKREGLHEEVVAQDVARQEYGHNGPSAVRDMTSMAELIASWPMPEEGLGRLEGAFEDDYSDFGGEQGQQANGGEDEEGDEDVEEDSASRQLKHDLASQRTGDSRDSGFGSEESDSENEDSDEDMSDA